MRFELIDLLCLPYFLCLTVAIALFYDRFLGRKYKSNALYIAAYSAFFIVESATFIFFYIRPPILPLVTTVEYFIIALALYSGTKIQRIIGGGILIALAFCSENLAFIAMFFALGYTAADLVPGTMAFLAATYVAAVLFIGIVIVITKNRKAKLLLSKSKYDWALLIIVWVGLGLSWVNISLLFTQSARSPDLVNLLIEIVIVALTVSAFLIFESLQIHAEQKERTAIVERQLWREEQRFTLIDEQFREVMAVKHDLTNHMTSVHKLLHDEKHNEAIDYLKDYLSQASVALTRTITGKPGVDALITEKIALAESEGVKFNLESEKLTTVKINPVHLNIILGNALDNAIEACRKLNGADRFISLGLKTEGDNLCIRVTNSSPAVEITDNELPATSKDDGTRHGFGLPAIKRLAEHYCGTVLCAYSEGEFTLYTLLVNNPDNRHLTQTEGI